MISSTVARKAMAFAQRPGFEQAWFVPVWLLLGTSRLLILFVPFRRLAPRLGQQAGIAPWVPLVGERREARAISIARVVALAARHTPWEANCFSQALAARILLGIYGVRYCLFFGIERGSAGTTMTAHAWIASGRVAVTGGASFDRFAVVACFVGGS